MANLPSTNIAITNCKTVLTNVNNLLTTMGTNTSSASSTADDNTYVEIITAIASDFSYFHNKITKLNNNMTAG